MPTNTTFVTRLTRGAVASTIAVGCLVPESHSALSDASAITQEMAMPNETFVPETAGYSDEGNTVVVTMPEMPKEWTKRMEREFRELALREAQGRLTPEEMAYLEALSGSRERLSCPRRADEVLLQLKRDRLLEKISETLRQYVEFQETAGKKRPATT